MNLLVGHSKVAFAWSVVEIVERMNLCVHVVPVWHAVRLEPIYSIHFNPSGDPAPQICQRTYNSEPVSFVQLAQVDL